MKKKLATALAGLVLLSTTVGCSTRKIDPEETNSWSIPGTSWYAFCDGPNAFIWVPSHTDSEPDELEAVIYDHYKCTGTDINPGTDPKPKSSTRPDTDPDGIVDDED